MSLRQDFQTGKTDVAMTQAEAELIVRLHMERVADGDANPTLSDVAEALKVPEAQVEALLAQVRATRPDVDFEARRKAKIRKDTRIALACLAAFLFVAFVVSMNLARHARGVSQSPAEITIPDMAADLAPIAPTGPPIFDAPDATVAGPFRIQIGNETHYLTNRSEEGLQQLLDRVNRGVTRRHQSAGEVDSAIKSIAGNNWNGAPMITMQEINVRHRDKRGLDMVAARATIPLYSGDDEKVDQLVSKEQFKRLAKALNLDQQDPNIDSVLGDSTAK